MTTIFNMILFRKPFHDVKTTNFLPENIIFYLKNETYQSKNKYFFLIFSFFIINNL